MTDQVTFPETRHVCNPGWELVKVDPASVDVPGGTFWSNVAAFWPNGTTVTCECGRVWVAYHPWDNVFFASWRPATWLERRRARRAAKTPTKGSV